MRRASGFWSTVDFNRNGIGMPWYGLCKCVCYLNLQERVSCDDKMLTRRPANLAPLFILLSEGVATAAGCTAAVGTSSTASTNIMNLLTSRTNHTIGLFIRRESSLAIYPLVTKMPGTAHNCRSIPIRAQPLATKLPGKRNKKKLHHSSHIRTTYIKNLVWITSGTAHNSRSKHIRAQPQARAAIVCT
jgi:hypothetical protein